MRIKELRRLRATGTVSVLNGPPDTAMGDHMSDNQPAQRAIGADVYRTKAALSFGDLLVGAALRLLRDEEIAG